MLRTCQPLSKSLRYLIRFILFISFHPSLQKVHKLSFNKYPQPEHRVRSDRRGPSRHRPKGAQAMTSGATHGGAWYPEPTRRRTSRAEAVPSGASEVV